MNDSKSGGTGKRWHPRLGSDCAQRSRLDVVPLPFARQLDRSTRRAIRRRGRVRLAMIRCLQAVDQLRRIDYGQLSQRLPHAGDIAELRTIPTAALGDRGQRAELARRDSLERIAGCLTDALLPES